MKRRLYLVQVNNRYGENVYLPYSVGLLWAYARTIPNVTEAWDLCGLLYRKESIERAVARLEDPDLVGVSAYIWNWRWSLAFAEAVKSKWPACKVVFGGVQVPDESSEILKYSFIDMAIYGEGEGAFADLLKELKPDGDLSQVGSLIYRHGNELRVNPRRAFVELDDLRSPYLDGVFDPILGDGWKWQVAQETHRGCPYSCTFCAWGQAALTKVRPFDMDRVLGEIRWFAKNRVEYVDNCDANFGILKRDSEIVGALIAAKREYGFPIRFRTSWAKNSNEKIFDMARDLHRADMLKAVTLSMQSMEAEVLTLVKRKNIKYDNLSALVERYVEEGMPTYTEIIMGLPGETLGTYLDGIDALLDAGQHDGLFCYPCLLLPNTEMNTPAEIERHGIVSVETEAMLSHGTPEPGAIVEMQRIVVATKTMPHTDWRRCYEYSWTIQVFHVLGLLQETARELRDESVRYQHFYWALIGWMTTHPETVAGRELMALRDLLSGVLGGGSWNCVDVRFGDISWPPEEFAFLRIVCEMGRFYDELEPFYASMGASVDLLVRQRGVIAPPVPGQEAMYARDRVWYGRKGAGAKQRRHRVS